MHLINSIYGLINVANKNEFEKIAKTKEKEANNLRKRRRMNRSSPTDRYTRELV